MDENQSEARIAAIRRNPPANTTIPFETLNCPNLSLVPPHMRDQLQSGQSVWPGYLLVRIRRGISPTVVSEVLQQAMDHGPSTQKVPPEMKERLGERKIIDIKLSRLRDAYFDREIVANFTSAQVDRGNSTIVAGLVAIAILILGLAALRSLDFSNTAFIVNYLTDCADFKAHACAMSADAYIAGVAMTPFVKPATSQSYQLLGSIAARAALCDAGLDYGQIQQAFVGYVYGDSTSGQAALYQVGLSGIPIINVNNNCATGSTALFLARQTIASGAADCVLALGFEQMAPGALQELYTDRPTPLSRFSEIADSAPGAKNAPMAIKLFGAAAIEYQERYGASDEIFAKIAVKARRHAEHNDRAIFRTPLTVEEVLASPKMLGPLTRFQCCPPTCGGAAAVVVSQRFARQHGLGRLVAIRAQGFTTDFESTFRERSPMKVVGYDLSRAAADQVYDQAGIGPEDIDVAELHDCFTANELISYEALRFTPEGTATRFVEDADNTYGGSIVTNPSGGLLAKGHPLGATGLAQCTEIVTQLRGIAGARQVPGARLGLQHNLGLGGACVVTLYERISQLL